MDDNQVSTTAALSAPEWRRLSAGKEASFISFVRDNEEAAGLFTARIAEVQVACVSVYEDLARHVGWTAAVVTQEELAMMRERAAKLAKIQNSPPDIVLTSL
jgi:hypothetical protein